MLVKLRYIVFPPKVRSRPNIDRPLVTVKREGDQSLHAGPKLWGAPDMAVNRGLDKGKISVTIAVIPGGSLSQIHNPGRDLGSLSQVS